MGLFFGPGICHLMALQPQHVSVSNLFFRSSNKMCIAYATGIQPSSNFPLEILVPNRRMEKNKPMPSGQVCMWHQRSRACSWNSHIVGKAKSSTLTHVLLFLKSQCWERPMFSWMHSDLFEHGWLENSEFTDVPQLETSISSIKYQIFRCSAAIDFHILHQIPYFQLFPNYRFPYPPSNTTFTDVPQRL